MYYAIGYSHSVSCYHCVKKWENENKEVFFFIFSFYINKHSNIKKDKRQ